MNEKENIEEKTEQQKENYERLIFAIAVYFADDLKIDIKSQVSYKDLTPEQKTFAQKIYEDKPQFIKQVNKDTRITEKTIVKDVSKVAKVAKEEKDKENPDLVKIVTVGDDRVCEYCAKWNNKIISLSGKTTGYPTLQDFINSKGLHYGCRCALLDVKTDEIPLKTEINPRYDERKRARPDIYNTRPYSDVGLIFI